VAQANGTILVVEDAEPIRKMVCAMLAQDGYTCIEAGDGAEALQKLEDQAEVSLVLTDLVMPRMSGSDLARHLSRTRPSLRVMLMSGYTDDPVVRSVDRSSVVFLAKPFTAAALKEKVREALDQPWNGGSIRV